MRQTTNNTMPLFITANYFLIVLLKYMPVFCVKGEKLKSSLPANQL